MTAESLQVSRRPEAAARGFGPSRRNFSSRFTQEFGGRWIIVAASRAAGARDCINSNFRSALFNQHFISIASSINVNDGRKLRREIRPLAEATRIDLINQRMPSSFNTAGSCGARIRPLTDRISDLVLDIASMELRFLYFDARRPRVCQAGPYHELNSMSVFKHQRRPGVATRGFGPSRITVMRMRFLIWMRQDGGKGEVFKHQRRPGVATRGFGPSRITSSSTTPELFRL